MSDSRRFLLSRTDITRRLQTVIGELLVVFVLAGAAHQVPGDGELAVGLALLGKLFVAFFATYALSSHVRYMLTSRAHHLDVAPDRLSFRTRNRTSVLELADVGHTERHARFREGPSLMLRLKNRRHVRLAGYEDQAELMALVEGHVARIQVPAPSETR